MSKDTIYRQMAIDALWEIQRELQMIDVSEGADITIHGVQLALHKIEQLPSAEKRGRWLKTPEEDFVVSGICSECGWEAEYYADDVAGMPYCPNCGARMED